MSGMTVDQINSKVSGGYGGGGNLGGLDGLDSLEGFDFGTNPEDDVMNTFIDLTPFEVEHFIESLDEFGIEDVGSSKWLTQHERTEKLNWTAHNQAKEGLDEFVVDQFNMAQKVPILIFDLVLVEVWKEKIYPLILSHIAKLSSLRSYIPVYHEATVINLLEILLFHRTTCEEAGDALVDLVDYCYRKLTYLVNVPNSELCTQLKSAKDGLDWDDETVLLEQKKECEFQICMSSISVIRFLTDHRVAIPLTITTRLLETHDILMLLVPLMEKAPWVRRNVKTGKLEKFEENQWEVMESEDEGRLPKLHSQIWLTIYNLIMDPECRARYEMTNFRKDNLLRLRRFLNEVVIDQLPPLTNLLRTLEELSIQGQLTQSSGLPPTSPFVVELVAEFWEGIRARHDGKWQAIADKQKIEVFTKESKDELKKLAHMISVPPELFKEEKSSGTAPTSSEDDTRDSCKDAMEALLRITSVCSTASFFASAKADVAPADALIVLSVPPQSTPTLGKGEKLRLELYRTQRLQYSARLPASQRAAFDTAWAAQPGMADVAGDAFAVACEATDAHDYGGPVLRWLGYVSTKGAPRSALQLRELLGKPGREDLLAMYQDDTAEFSILTDDIPKAASTLMALTGK